MPRGWGFSTIFVTQGSGFRTSFVPGRWGIRPFKRIPPGEGWWSGLELANTLGNEHQILTYPEWWLLCKVGDYECSVGDQENSSWLLIQ